MWVIDEVQVRRRGRPSAESSAYELWADGRQIANHAERTSWAGTGQAIMCGCAVEGCESGGWVRLRRSDDRALLLPDFEGMLERPAEASPPAYIRSAGVPVLGRRLAEHLAEQVPGWPSFDSIPALRRRDVPRLMQWEAPRAILGSFPEPPRVRREDVLASSRDETDPWLDRLEAVIEALVDGEEVVELARVAEAQITVELYLDAPVHTVWRPLAEVSGVLSVCPLEGWAAVLGAVG